MRTYSPPVSRLPRRAWFLVLLLSALVLLAVGVDAQHPVSKVRAEPGWALEAVGATAAFDGDTAVTFSDMVDNQGNAFVIERTPTGWKRGALLPFVDTASPWGGIHYGTNVTIQGDTIFVGATGNDDVGDEAGIVTIHQRDDVGTPANRLDDAWPQIGFLLGGDIGPVGHFGYAISVDGDTVVTGEPGENFNRGRAYVSERQDSGTPGDPFDDTWLRIQTLVPPGDPAQSRFGHAVAVSGNLLAVGDPYVGFVGQVDTWLRVGDGWVHNATLTPPGPDPNSFGFSLALEDHTLIVGHTGQSSMGEALFYTFDDGGTPTDPTDDGWTPDGVIQVSSVYADFGYSVALDGDRAAISAVTTFGFFKLGGLVCEATRTPDGWEMVRTFRAVDDEIGDRFGTALDLSGGELLVGARGDKDQVSGSGAVWFLDLDADSPWSVQVGTGLGWGSGGQVPRLVGWGRLSDNHDVAMKLLDADSGDDGWLVLGTSALFAPFKGGVLVPAPQVVAGPAVTDSDGHILLEFQWWRDVPSGAELYAQWWLFRPGPEGGWYAPSGLLAVEP